MASSSKTSVNGLTHGVSASLDTPWAYPRVITAIQPAAIVMPRRVRNQ
jgi:hypothetical protein